MGENMIIALIFILVSFTMIAGVAQSERYNMHRNNLQSSIILEAKELKTFSDAAFDYGISFNVPLSASSFTVSNLQSYGLLPSTFPQTTPFGQTFQADYATDACNGDVMDLLIKTSGSYNNDLLAKNGLKGTIGINYINSEVDKTLSGLNVSYQNANNPCVANGQPDYIGSTIPGSSGLELYGGGSISTNVTSSNDDSAIYIYAPNQWGYLIINSNIYGDGEVWGYIDYNSVSSDWGLGQAFWYFSSQGWSMTCPADSIILNPGSTSSNFITDYSSNGVNYTQNITYCIPIYKAQTVNFNYYGGNNAQLLNNGVLYARASWGGTFPDDVYYTGENDPTYSTQSFIGQSQISGLNNELFGIEGFIGTNTDVPGYPATIGSNYIPPEAMQNDISALGFDINANGNTYQFVGWSYALFTGSGCSLSQLGIPTTNAEEQSYPAGASIWADGYNNNTAPGSGSCPANSQNLGTSQENIGIGYYVTVNPSNSSSETGRINYEQSNGAAVNTVYFTIPTPQIN
jgi:hypothetical protein